LIELFFAQREFTAYGPSHLVVLAVFAIGATLLIWIGRRQTESQARLLGRVLAVLIAAAFVVALVYKLIRPDIQTSVPLQLCDIAELTAAYALWSQRTSARRRRAHPIFRTIFSSRSSRFTCSSYGRPSISHGGVACVRGGATTALRSS
jgi:hypothetical protein